MTKLGFQLDPESNAPLYAQIQRAIEDRIDSGAFPSGFRLPATRSLAEELGTLLHVGQDEFDSGVAAGERISAGRRR